MDTTMTVRQWTDIEVELIKKLVTEGRSAAEIAAQLHNRTRNAVIGVMHRKGIGFAAKPQTVKKERASRAGRSIKVARLFMTAKDEPKQEDKSDVSANPPDTKNYVRFLERRSSQCKYIVEKRGETYYCCGGPVDRNGWCAYHAAIVYRPIDPKHIDRNDPNKSLSRSSK